MLCVIAWAGCGGGGGAASVLAPAAGVSSASPGWRITVYYTAVMSYYAGPLQAVSGCPDLTCSRTNVLLGNFPRDFVQTTRTEGTGKISTGSYLNWSGSTGYWLDTAPRNAQGTALVAFRSAAADPSIAFGATFHVLNCGADTATGTPTDSGVCQLYSTPSWIVADRFEAGNVGKQVDLYIGEQDAVNFTAGAKIIDALNAVLQF